jgi:magnesium and cobalt transporter
MIQSILEFRDTVVREVMIPRTEMVAVSDDASIAEIIELVTNYGYTRIPVYHGTIDNIVGILNVKDLLKFWSKPMAEKEILSILRKPFYIPETKNTRLLLHELKQSKSHMAIVIDEYGGTAGLVTLEDLIEEIVGEIHDEDDTQEGEILDLADGYKLVDARTDIEKIEDHFGVSLPEGEYETLGGMILYVIGRIPVAGEQVQIQPFEMIIESADERSIRKVKMKRASGTRDGGDA